MPGATGQGIWTQATDQRIVADAAIQDIGTHPSQQGIIACIAIQGIVPSAPFYVVMTPIAMNGVITAITQQHIIACRSVKVVISTGPFYRSRHSGSCGSNVDGQLGGVLITIVLHDLIGEDIRLADITQVRERSVGIGTITVDLEGTIEPGNRLTGSNRGITAAIPDLEHSVLAAQSIYRPPGIAAVRVVIGVSQHIALSSHDGNGGGGSGCDVESDIVQLQARVIAAATATTIEHREVNAITGARLELARSEGGGRPRIRRQETAVPRAGLLHPVGTIKLIQAPGHHIVAVYIEPVVIEAEGGGAGCAGHELRRQHLNSIP
ncbi:hypothetical protein D3C85_834570 [compost metagenome]